LAAWRIGQAAARQSGARLLAYPVWGWTLPPDREIDDAEAARAGWRLDVAAMLPAKRAAVASHRTQLGQVITDDPGGFVLPTSLLQDLMKPDEVYLLGNG
jgi:hypothetical protein